MSRVWKCLYCGQPTEGDCPMPDCVERRRAAAQRMGVGVLCGNYPEFGGCKLPAGHDGCCGTGNPLPEWLNHWLDVPQATLSPSERPAPENNR